jgi:hypothetical protein
MIVVLPLMTVGLNVVWFAVLIGMVAHGAKRSKPGLVVAPFIFATLWIGASAAQRWWIEASLDPKVWDRPIDPQASAQRTLIMRGSGSVDPKIIADGHIDRLIKVQHGEQDKIIGFEEISLASGDACSAEERRASSQLQKAGRREECFKLRSLAEVPDGLVVEQVRRAGGFGCCAETQARLRSGGNERLLFSWYRGETRVLSYFPVFSFLNPSTRLWEGGRGVMQPVHYGLEDIEPIGMISATYGVEPPYHQDYGMILPRPALSAADMLDQAETFSRQPNVSPKRVADLLIAARNQGLVDGRSIDIAVALAGHDNDGWNGVTEFAKGLTDDQIELLVEELMNRLETPNLCEDCVTSRYYSSDPALRELKLRERLANPEALQDRAIRILGQRHDLAIWQYEGALKIMAGLGPQQYPESAQYFEGSLLPLILLDDTPAYSDKAMAFLRASPRRPTSGGPRLAARLDLVRDRDLREYITRIWSDDLRRLSLSDARPENAIAAKACKRIAGIADPAVRDQEFPVDCSFPSK